jgi:RNA polymerase sigma factor (TIGR02999 family)
MTGMSSDSLTSWLEASRRGEPGAFDRAFGAVYDELHALAHAQLRRLRPGGTISTTVLVHEAYLRLARAGDLAIETRRHFFALAAQAMRRILVDQARARGAAKRGGGAATLSLDESALPIGALAEEVLAVDRALDRLGALDARQAQIVEWRFFAGLGEEEIAESLGLTARTVRREWTKARAFLYRELHGEAAGTGP